MNETQRRVRDMWEANYPTRDIGAALGMTKNAVCGMLKRMRDNGIQLSSRSNKPPALRDKVKKIATLKKVTALKKRPSPSVTIAVEHEPIVPDPPLRRKQGPVGLLDLHALSCRYIINGTRGANALFCGEVKETGSYCAAHAALCFRRD